MCRRYGPLRETHLVIKRPEPSFSNVDNNSGVALFVAWHTGASWFKFGRNSVAFPVLRSKLSGSYPVGILFVKWKSFLRFCLSPDMNWTIVFRFCKDFSFLPFLCSLFRKNRDVESGREESEISELSFESVLFEECIILNLRRMENI